MTSNDRSSAQCADELVLCGTAHHKAGRLPQAEECYRAAIAADRRNFAALHQLGVCLNAQGKPDECMQWIR
nr:hypothetical protein [Methylotetracoccus sp.]